MLRRIALVVAAIALGAQGACGGATWAPDRVTVVLTQGSARLEIRAEVASTPAGRESGLMGRRSLAPGSGMVFLFPERVHVGFYMKDTLIPLDIAFIRGGVVSEVRSMVPCAADPCPVTTPDEPYDEALEVGQGTFSRAGIGVGAEAILHT